MPANYTDIERALVTAVVAQEPLTPTSYPNKPLGNEEKAQGLWLALHNLRALSNPATLGDAGEDNHPGVFQVDINYPQNKGTRAVLNKADSILAVFTAGQTFTYNGQHVRIIGTSLSPGRLVGGYYQVNVSITYYARTTRN